MVSEYRRKVEALFIMNERPPQNANVIAIRPIAAERLRRDRLVRAPAADA
jgi:hypothetical protein